MTILRLIRTKKLELETAFFPIKFFKHRVFQGSTRKAKTNVLKAMMYFNGHLQNLYDLHLRLCIYFPSFQVIVSDWISVYVSGTELSATLETYVFHIVKLWLRNCNWPWQQKWLFQNACLRSSLLQLHLRPETQESIVRKTKLSWFTFHEVNILLFTRTKRIQFFWILDYATPPRHSWSVVVTRRISSELKSPACASLISDCPYHNLTCIR